MVHDLYHHGYKNICIVSNATDVVLIAYVLPYDLSPCGYKHMHSQQWYSCRIDSFMCFHMTYHHVDIRTYA